MSEWTLRAALRRWILVWTVGSTMLGAGTPAAGLDCGELVRPASVAARSAQYDRAQSLLDELDDRVPDCQVHVAVLRASIFNSQAESKRALSAAARAIAGTQDAALLAEAHYQAGRAHYRGQSRSAKKARPAEMSFLRAVEVSRGGHEMALRMLMRLYRNTRQTEKLAALEAESPEVRLPVMKPPPKPKKEAAEKRPRFVRRANGEVEGPENHSAPTFREVTPPGYPEAAVADGVEGAVLLEILIDVEGVVEAVKLLTPLHPALDQAALTAAEAARFAPAKDPADEPVACELVVEVSFAVPVAVDEGG